MNSNVKIFLFILVFTFIGCKSGTMLHIDYDKTKDSFDTNGGIIMPVFSDEKKIFKESKQSKKIRANDSIFCEYNYPDGYKKYVFKKNKIEEVHEFYSKLIELELSDTLSVNLNLYYESILKYYPSGKLKKYESYLLNADEFYPSVAIGKWYYFNENGLQIKEIDHEKEFKIQLEEFFIIKSNIASIQNMFYRINKQKWITEAIDFKSKQYKVYIINDVTKKTEEFIFKTTEDKNAFLKSILVK